MTKLSIAVLLLAGLVVVTGVRAQDGPDLEGRVEALETRVAALETTPIAVRVVGADNVLTFQGTGDAISEPFALPAGSAILTVESADAIRAVVYPWPGIGNIGFISTPRGEAGQASRVIGAWDSGDYVVEVNADTAWTVTIEYP